MAALDFSPSQHGFSQYFEDEALYFTNSYPPAPSCFIDPGLAASDEVVEEWSDNHPPQMQRYLEENQKRLLFQASQEAASLAASPHLSPYQASDMFGRCPSLSSQPYSSGPGGRQSPPVESDYFHDGIHGPATPQDAPMPPFQPKGAYESIDGQTTALRGVWGSNSEGVNLAELQSVSTLQMDSIEPNMIPLNSDLQSYRARSPVFASTPYLGPQSVPFTPGETQESDMMMTDRDRLARPSPPIFSKYAEITSTDDRVIFADQSSPPSAVSSSGMESKGRHAAHNTLRKGNRRKGTGSRKRTKRSDESPTIQIRQEYTHSLHLQQPLPSVEEVTPKLISVVSSASKQCGECSLIFKDEERLQNHIKTKHTRAFTCVFHYAGCEYTFAAKNEWKRHVLSQHLALKYWVCDEPSCRKATDGPARRRSTSFPTLGTVFNRKDLFTQHVRRMHAPPGVPKTSRDKKSNPEWEEKEKAMQAKAEQLRCSLPTYMQCPARDCTVDFKGDKAWDDRMEHVARHLEQAAAGKEPPVYFGGLGDTTLTEWAARDDVSVTRKRGSKWEMCNPLKDAPFPKKRAPIIPECDEDAEGEDC